MTHKEFVEEARNHQTKFFKRYGEGIDCYTTSDPRSKSNNPDKRVWLTMDNARKGLVFYEGIRKEVLQLPEIKSRVAREPRLNDHGKIKQDLLLSVTLRSEHIPYNLFYPLIKDKDNPYVVKIFNRMLDINSIRSINEIVIEYAPAPQTNYLNDGTSFDVFVEYTDIFGNRSGIGIEVKYTEKEYDTSPKSKEWTDTHDSYGKPLLASHYKEMTESSGYYNESVECMLVTDYLRQIWRNHILGFSMVHRGDLTHFHSLTIYPSKNQHFTEAGAVYNSLLTDKGQLSFGMITYEDYINLLKEILCDDDSKKWIDYLKERYLF